VTGQRRVTEQGDGESFRLCGSTRYLGRQKAGNKVKWAPGVVGGPFPLLTRVLLVFPESNPIPLATNRNAIPFVRPTCCFELAFLHMKRKTKSQCTVDSPPPSISRPTMYVRWMYLPTYSTGQRGCLYPLGSLPRHFEPLGQYMIQSRWNVACGEVPNTLIYLRP